MISYAPTVDASRLQELFDRQDIRDQLLRYSRGCDRFDAELINSVYWPDALDEHGPVGTVPGAQAGELLIRWMRDSCKVAQHFLCSSLIEIEGDTAFVETYFLNFLLVDRDGRDVTRSFGGRYIDRFERRGGIWRIAHRVCVHDWSRMDEVDEPWPPGEATFIQGERSKDDIVYTIARGFEAAHARVPGSTLVAEPQK